MLPDVDLVISFRASRKTSLLKRHALEDAPKAEQQYTRLINMLTSAGLRAVARPPSRLCVVSDKPPSHSDTARAVSGRHASCVGYALISTDTLIFFPGF